MLGTPPIGVEKVSWGIGVTKQRFTLQCDGRHPEQLDACVTDGLIQVNGSNWTVRDTGNGFKIVDRTSGRELLLDYAQVFEVENTLRIARAMGCEGLAKNEIYIGEPTP